MTTTDPNAAVAGGYLVLDDDWRDELVLHRDGLRCTAPVYGADGVRERCPRTATLVVEAPDYALDRRDPTAHAASCHVHAESWSHAPTRGRVHAR